MDSSDIATPPGMGLLKKSRFCVEFSIFRALALVVFAVSESRLSERPGSFRSPGSEQQRNGVQIGLQCNNKYSFERERPGLI
jgi:hypothetical protein